MFFKNILRWPLRLLPRYAQPSQVFPIRSFHFTSIVSGVQYPSYRFHSSASVLNIRKYTTRYGEPVTRAVGSDTRVVEPDITRVVGPDMTDMAEPDLAKLDKVLSDHVEQFRQHGFTVPRLVTAVDEMFDTVFDDSLKHLPGLLYRDNLLSKVNLESIRTHTKNLKLYYSDGKEGSLAAVNEIILKNDARLNGFEALYILNKLFFLGMDRDHPVYTSLLLKVIEEKESLTLDTACCYYLFTKLELIDIYFPILRKTLLSTNNLSAWDIKNMAFLLHVFGSDAILTPSLKRGSQRFLEENMNLLTDLPVNKLSELFIYLHKTLDIHPTDTGLLQRYISQIEQYIERRHLTLRESNFACKVLRISRKSSTQKTIISNLKRKLNNMDAM